MSVKLNISKKGKILIIVLLVLILGGSGGYLLWRTNQPETVAPTDSEATGGAGACCNPKYGCVAGWKCKTDGCNETLCVDEDTCPSYKGIEGAKKGKCQNDPWKDKTKCDYEFTGTCVRETDPGGPSEGDCKDTKCTWPKVVMSDNNCACELCNGSNGCSGDPPKCQPAACPSGYEDCGTTAESGHDASGCVKQEDKFCTVYHKDCNNPSTIYRYCKKKDTSSNTCDGGEWLTKPTGKYKYCDPITYSAKAKDSDGIDKASVVVKLNGVKRTKFTIDNVKTASLVVTEPLSTTTSCLSVGSYTLSLSWKDKKGATSTACSLSTTFKITKDDAPEVNPEWNITKTGAEQCLENGDAEVIYTISIKNIGEGTGSIDKIVDTLDSKVLASYITGTISDGGLFGSGNITWELEEEAETFAPEQEKTYRYTLVIPKTAFGSYTNTVTAYPTTGENFSDSVTVVVDCEQDIPPEDIPQTGLFDSTVAKIVAGIVLLLLGFNLHRADTSFKRVQNSLQKLSISMQDSQDERRKRNFEKKIVKK